MSSIFTNISPLSSWFNATPSNPTTPWKVTTEAAETVLSTVAQGVMPEVTAKTAAVAEQVAQGGFFAAVGGAIGWGVQVTTGLAVGTVGAVATHYLGSMAVALAQNNADRARQTYSGTAVTFIGMSLLNLSPFGTAAKVAAVGVTAFRAAMLGQEDRPAAAKQANPVSIWEGTATGIAVAAVAGACFGAPTALFCAAVAGYEMSKRL